MGRHGRESCARTSVFRSNGAPGGSEAWVGQAIASLSSQSEEFIEINQLEGPGSSSQTELIASSSQSNVSDPSSLGMTKTRKRKPRAPYKILASEGDDSEELGSDGRAMIRIRGGVPRKAPIRVLTQKPGQTQPMFKVNGQIIDEYTNLVLVQQAQISAHIRDLNLEVVSLRQAVTNMRQSMINQGLDPGKWPQMRQD